jgi:hypothetical protein
MATTACGQIRPSDDRLILYHLDRMPEGYVLCMSFESPENAKTSHLVIGDTFSVQPDGAVCFLVMSNAYILQTTFGHSPSNGVAQTKIWVDVYKMPFPKHTKLVFNNSVVELPQMKIQAPGEANAKTYEGNDALRQLKKMGLEPPNDMDKDKAVGHQKQ